MKSQGGILPKLALNQPGRLCCPFLSGAWREGEMIKAQCCCGSLVAELPGPTDLVVACHCIECQRRTGAPFGVGAFYPSDQVRITGDVKEYQRPASSGASVRSYFCPNCGTTLYWQADRLPAFVAIAVGAIADPKFPHPRRSVFEKTKHHWVQIDAAPEHFPMSSL